MVRLLLDDGASVGEAYEEAWTALHLVITGRHSAAVTLLLLRRGAPVDVAGSDGNTLLHWATKFEQELVVRQLLSRGIVRETSSCVSNSVLAVGGVYDFVLVAFVRSRIQSA